MEVTETVLGALFSLGTDPSHMFYHVLKEIKFLRCMNCFRVQKKVESSQNYFTRTAIL